MNERHRQIMEYRKLHPEDRPAMKEATNMGAERGPSREGTIEERSHRAMLAWQNVRESWGRILGGTPFMTAEDGYKNGYMHGFDAGREAAMARFKALVEKAMIECRNEAGKEHGYRHIDPQEHAANVLETLLIVVAAQDRG